MQTCLAHIRSNDHIYGHKFANNVWRDAFFNVKGATRDFTRKPVNEANDEVDQANFGDIGLATGKQIKFVEVVHFNAHGRRCPDHR